MALGLTPEAYAVMVADDIVDGYEPNARVAALASNGGLLIFRSWNEANSAVQDYMSQFPHPISGGGTAYLPKHIWVAPVYRHWIDGVQQ